MRNKGVKLYQIALLFINIVSITILFYNIYKMPEGNKTLFVSVCTVTILIPIIAYFLYMHDIKEEEKLRSKNDKTYKSTIEALGKLVDERDTYMGEHSKNVLNYVERIVNRLDLDKQEADDIKVAASFHDIGKIGINDAILKNPGKLSFEEFQVMKTHSSIGADIIEKTDEFNNIAKIIRHHHERWDGFGYPEGLKGDSIPIGSQIIAIADTYDALTSDRIYRKGMLKKSALEIIEGERGKQFNPEIVEVALKELV